MEAQTHRTESVSSEPNSRPHHRGLVRLVGVAAKRVAPILSSVVRLWPDGAAYAAMYTEVLLGKGAGAGWDLQSETDVALRFLRSKRPTVFDLGAHQGSWSRAIVEARPEARLIQFEPNPENIAILEEAQLPNVEVVATAVSDRKGVTSFYASSTSDLGSLHRRRESIFQDRTYKAISINTVTLDDILSERCIERVDFVKMDIEGHELQALAGAEKSLASGRIRTLSFEFGSGNINSRTFFHDFWDLLTPLGFRIYRVCPGGWLLPITAYYEDLEYFRNVTNYVATLEPLPDG